MVEYGPCIPKLDIASILPNWGREKLHWLTEDVQENISGNI